MNYSVILEELLVGSYPQTAADIDRLAGAARVTAVLSLQTDEDISYLRYNWTAIESHCSASNIIIKRVPVRDFDAVDLCARLPVCVEALRELLAAGHRVYLHCTAGAGRSPSVAIAYLNWCLEWDLEEAVAYVKRCRPCSPNLEAIRLAAPERR